MSELALPLYGQYFRVAHAKPFTELRKSNPQVFNFRLVTRLGEETAVGRQMLDNSLYAERYLRLPGPDEKNVIAPHIWLDQKAQFAADQVAAMHRAVAIVQGQGLADNPFAAGTGLARPWPLVIDNHSNEIGMIPKDSTEQHRPVVAARIAEVNGGKLSVKLQDTGRARQNETPPALYFAVGNQVSNGKAKARITAIDATSNSLLLDRVDGFNAGDEIASTWPGPFPANDCFIFYGFYGLGQYEDVFQFLPGAVGVHVDSSCMNWARGAMRRNIAATFGVTSEPLSAGIPHGDQMILALAAGFNWAEAVYGSLRLGQRWAGVAFGDPLYAPFRSRQLVDKTPPVLGKPHVGCAGKDNVFLAELIGNTDDELADVAMFRIEYGPTSSYGHTIDFYDWPEPGKSKGVPGRRFAYSRKLVYQLKGLESGKTYHYRITARDPAGNEAVSPDSTFVSP